MSVIPYGRTHESLTGSMGSDLPYGDTWIEEKKVISDQHATCKLTNHIGQVLGNGFQFLRM